MRKICTNLSLCKKIMKFSVEIPGDCKTDFANSLKDKKGRWVYLFIFFLFKCHWNQGCSSCYNVTCSWIFTEFKSWGCLPVMWDVPLEGISVLAAGSLSLDLLHADMNARSLLSLVPAWGQVRGLLIFLSFDSKGTPALKRCVGKQIEEYYV